MATLRGSCQCGGVRFELPDEFLSMSFCHCATCKKISGGVGTASAGVRTESVRRVAGQDLVRKYQPAECSAKTFCSVCGAERSGRGWPNSAHTEVYTARLAPRLAVDRSWDRPALEVRHSRVLDRVPQQQHKALESRQNRLGLARELLSDELTPFQRRGRPVHRVTSSSTTS